ncbi:hypothetical protein PMAYCL1PPCAC_30312, partial [Pristionchus mayeri]
LLQALVRYHQRPNRVTTVPIPRGIDPKVLMQERENRISERIALRIKDLSNNKEEVPPHLRIVADIELRALKLVNFQAQIRNEVMQSLKFDTTLHTAVNPYAYRRVKKQSLREARITEQLEKQRKVEQEWKKKQSHGALLNAIMQHSRQFKEFHRSNARSTDRTKRAVLTWHQNSDRERKKEEARNEQMRMQLLKQEDEEGYKKLLDEKKDKRLLHLLEQTDAFIGSLTDKVKAHQSVEKRKKREEKALANNDGRILLISGVRLREISTGKFLPREETPIQEEVESWLAAHPEYEIAPKDVFSDDSEDEDEVAIPFSC